MLYFAFYWRRIGRRLIIMANTRRGGEVARQLECVLAHGLLGHSCKTR